MKKFLIKILGLDREFKKAFDSGFSLGIKQLKEELTAKEEIDRISLNYPKDSVVMVVGNSPGHNYNPEKITLAKVVGYHLFHNRPHLILKDESSGEEFTTFAKVILYDENRYNCLVKLSWWERYNVVSQWGPSLNYQQAKNLENGRPAWDNGE